MAPASSYMLSRYQDFANPQVMDLFNQKMALHQMISARLIALAATSYCVLPARTNYNGILV